MNISWIHNQPILLAVIILTVSLALGFFLKKTLFKKLSKLAKKTNTQLDDVIFDATSRYIVIWFFIFGFYFAINFSSFSDRIITTAGKIILVLGIFSLMVFINRIVIRFIYIYSSKIDSKLKITSFIQTVSRILIFGVGILIILNTLGIAIAPILATLGIGGLAVALALQDSLANLFAGFHLIINKQIKIGDYIKLESGEEGYVLDINWRITKIKMLQNNVVLVPNSKINQSTIINYYLPDKEIAVLIDIGVHYKSNLLDVEKTTCEVAEQVISEVSGAVPGFKPFIRYNAFADFCVKFTVILRAKEFVDQYLIKHEFIKRIHERYKKEGISIPYPITAINYSQEEALKR